MRWSGGVGWSRRCPDPGRLLSRRASGGVHGGTDRSPGTPIQAVQNAVGVLVTRATQGVHGGTLRRGGATVQPVGDSVAETRLAAEKQAGKVDFRAIRFPGLISAVTVPSGGTSDFAPEMIHAAAQGKPYACFVRPDTRIPFMASAAACVRV